MVNEGGPVNDNEEPEKSNVISLDSFRNERKESGNELQQGDVGAEIPLEEYQERFEALHETRNMIKGVSLDALGDSLRLGEPGGIAATPLELLQILESVKRKRERDADVEFKSEDLIFYKDVVATLEKLFAK